LTKKGPALKQKQKRRNDAIGKPSLKNSSLRFTALGQSAMARSPPEATLVDLWFTLAR